MAIIRVVAVSLAAITAVTFIGPMIVFFRARRGARLARLLLAVSVFGATGGMLTQLYTQTAVTLMPQVVGRVLLISANGLFGWAMHSFGQYRPSSAFATDAPPVLNLRGPYRYIRHPFYVAYLLAFSGGAWLTEAAWVGVVPCYFLVFYWQAARAEEKAILVSPLAEQYKQYCKNVGGFVPKLFIFRK